MCEFVSVCVEGGEKNIHILAPGSSLFMASVAPYLIYEPGLARPPDTNYSQLLTIYEPGLARPPDTNYSQLLTT